METLLRMSKGMVFKMMGAATAKLREPKHVRTEATNNELQRAMDTAHYLRRRGEGRRDFNAACSRYAIISGSADTHTA